MINENFSSKFEFTLLRDGEAADDVWLFAFSGTRDCQDGDEIFRAALQVVQLLVPLKRIAYDRFEGIRCICNDPSIIATFYSLIDLPNYNITMKIK